MSKTEAVHGVIERFRAATNHDRGFDALAAERLGISETDLHCLSAAERRGGATAGELAAESGLTTGAVTAVIDRLERAGYARRVRDEKDRRKVNVEVTPEFYEAAGPIWGPVAEDWEKTLGARFTAEQLATIAQFLEHVDELGLRH